MRQRSRASCTANTSNGTCGKRKPIEVLSADNHLMVVPISFGANNEAIEIGTPKPLFPIALHAGSECRFLAWGFEGDHNADSQKAAWPLLNTVGVLSGNAESHSVSYWMVECG